MPTPINIDDKLDEAERKAWDSLGRYKFLMFGYWSGVWVHLNQIAGSRRPNPWKELVQVARVHTGDETPSEDTQAVLDLPTDPPQDAPFPLYPAQPA